MACTQLPSTTACATWKLQCDPTLAHLSSAHLGRLNRGDANESHGIFAHASADRSQKELTRYVSASLVLSLSCGGSRRGECRSAQSELQRRRVCPVAVISICRHTITRSRDRHCPHHQDIYVHTHTFRCSGCHVPSKRSPLHEIELYLSSTASRRAISLPLPLLCSPNVTSERCNVRTWSPAPDNA